MQVFFIVEDEAGTMHIDKDKGEGALKFNISRPAAVEFLLVAGGFLAARALVFDAASPFVLAYISAFLFRGNKFYGAALFAALGIITSFRAEFSMKYLLAIIVLCLANLFLSFRPKMTAPMLQAAAVAIASVVSGIVIIFLRGQGAYYFAVNLLEAALIFALAIVLSKGIACVAPRAKRKPLSNEELISLVVLVGVLAVGASDVYIWQFSLRHIFAILIVLLAAQSGGAAIGAVCGVFLGFLLNITGFEYIYFAVLLSCAGFAAGSLRGFGRPLPILGFIAVGTLCALYFDLTLLTLGMLLSALVAAAVFYFLPRGFLLNIHAAVNPATQDNDEYMGKVKSRVASRVYDFAAGYGKLATLFERRIVGRKKPAARPEKLADAIKNEFCVKCHKSQHCWGEKAAEMDEYVTYLAEKSEKSGKIDIDDAPLGLSSMCIVPVDFIKALWAQLGKQKAAKDLEQRLTEARTLVAQQFSGLSAVMYEFADELDAALNFKKELENKIIRELEKLRIEVESVIVIENKQGKCEVSISRKGRRDDALQAREIGEVLSGVTGRRMELVEERFAGRMVRMEFFERHKFYVHSGVAKASKGVGDSVQSGDSFSLVQLKDGRCIAALSDGMGSGRRAREESECAIELLEELMERGFQKDIALRLINSALLLKTDDEFFSTLDICLLDMNTGLAEFVKIGAAASYLVRGGEVSAIGSWTLPVGILEFVDIDVHEEQLVHGDIVVLMTDGVADSRKGAENTWITHLLSNLRTGNPQDIAEHILAAAKENYGDMAGDDMTVLVLRVLERS
ncbi:MAG: stage II sporulation protein E [Defluviitaleaceae bacterium]|nr:stage II sporulation protein E [Defluviitaleaceae bacterium]